MKDNHFLVFVFFIWVMIGSVYSQEWHHTTKEVQNSYLKNFYYQDANDNRAPQKQQKKPLVLISFGTNLSSFPGEEGEWQLGYSLGLTFNIHVYQRLSMTIPLSYTRINADLKNVEGRTFPDFGENIYKTLNDWQVSIVFFEIPMLFAYKFISKNSYDIRYILGPGLAITVKDFSEQNFRRTDEILGIEQYGSPIDPSTNDLLSGLNIITGISIHVSRFYINILYTFFTYDIKSIYKLDSESKYPYGIKKINKLNSISIKLDIDIF